MSFAICLRSGPAFFGHAQGKINHTARNIDTGRGDAIAKFHGVVDFVDQQATIGVFRRIQSLPPPPTALATRRRCH